MILAKSTLNVRITHRVTQLATTSLNVFVQRLVFLLVTGKYLKHLSKGISSIWTEQARDSSHAYT